MDEQRDRVIEAMMRLLADRPYEEVTLSAIAGEASLSLAELAATFSSRGAILAAFVRKIDREVLAQSFSDMTEEAPRERLFDVLMSRIEALRPYRAALVQLMRAARRDPQLGLALNVLAVRSHGWMLAAAGIVTSGWRGRLATQGLAVSFLKVLRVFVEEDDPGMPRTMAALDRELREGERRNQRFARIFGGGVREDPSVRAARFADLDVPPTDRPLGASFANRTAAKPDAAASNDDLAAMVELEASDTPATAPPLSAGDPSADEIAPTMGSDPPAPPIATPALEVVPLPEPAPEPKPAADEHEPDNNGEDSQSR